jgi:hypothetical protein
MSGVDFAGRIGRTIAESQPWWPPGPARAGRPNVLVVLFDDVGFADFGCYGSTLSTPTIDALASRGLRLSGFHTTAMCSTTRAALMTGCNHHRVGMGCLANFDSGFPGYRGKIAPEASTLAEMLRGAGYANYMVGKWHVTPLTETGPTGPFDGWPLGRGYDRFYGFMDAETDQYAPELVRDNTPIPCPGSHASGYHLSTDLVDQAVRDAGRAPRRPPAAALAPVAGAGCLPRAAPGAAGPGPQLRRTVRHGWDVGARTAAWRGRRRWASFRPAPRCRRATTACKPWDEPAAAAARADDAAAGGLCGDAGPLRPAAGAAGRLPARSAASSTTRWWSCCRTTAPARKAGRWASSTPWARTTCAPSRRPRRSPGWTTSAAPTHTPTSPGAGRCAPTRRSSATSRTPMAAASATRW